MTIKLSDALIEDLCARARSTHTGEAPMRLRLHTLPTVYAPVLGSKPTGLRGLKRCPRCHQKVQGRGFKPGARHVPERKHA